MVLSFRPRARPPRRYNNNICDTVLKSTSDDQGRVPTHTHTRYKIIIICDIVRPRSSAVSIVFVAFAYFPRTSAVSVSPRSSRKPRPCLYMCPRHTSKSCTTATVPHNNTIYAIYSIYTRTYSDQSRIRIVLLGFLFFYLSTCAASTDVGQNVGD